MEYIINGVLQYNSVDGTLYLHDDSLDMVTLNRVTNELLLLFISNNNKPLSRDIILNELWSKRGLNASSNNLNNYVSILRKALSHCGCSDLITTIPKHGFIFKADIILASSDEKYILDIHDSAPEGEEKKVSVLSDKIRKREKTFISLLKNKKQIAIFILVLIGVWQVYAIYISSSEQRTEILRIGQCRFYLTDDTTRELNREKTLRNIKDIFQRENLNCDRKATIFYFSDIKRDVEGNHIRNDLLTYCTNDSRNPCVNYYVSKHEEKNENSH